MSQKSYDGTPILYLIPTPIGNLDDITLRTIKILNEVSVIFSEDTRITGLLLKHLDIKKKLISSHKYNEDKTGEILLEYLENGESVGLVSDRGTPIVSDPGYTLVNKAIEKNYNVVALPGATALIPALIVSGLSSEHFYFYGFLNNKEGKRKKELEILKPVKDTIIFYEAPHRILDTLKDILEVMGNRKISISREISKKFEEIIRGNITSVLDTLKEPKGEFVIVIEGNNEVNSYSNLTVIEHVNLYIKEGKNSKEAIKLVATDRKIDKKEVYNKYHNIK